MNARKARQRRYAERLADPTGLRRELRAYAKTVRQRRRLPPDVLGHYTAFIEYVAAHGRPYVNHPTPPGVALGPDGICWTNAQRLARARPDLTYCEGMATEPAGPGYREGWNEHGWCADADGNVIEPTWTYWPPRRYFGLPVPPPWPEPHPGRPFARAALLYRLQAWQREQERGGGHAP